MAKHQAQAPSQMGNWYWFNGYGPKKIKGLYTGLCKHLGRTVIAHGPDLRHYTLDECDNCYSRAWFTDKETRSTPWMEMLPQ